MLPQCMMISLNTHVSIYAFSVNFSPLCDSQIQYCKCGLTGPRHTAIIIPFSYMINSWAWAKMQLAVTTVQEDLKSHVRVQKKHLLLKNPTFNTTVHRDLKSPYSWEIDFKSISGQQPQSDGKILKFSICRQELLRKQFNNKTVYNNHFLSNNTLTSD